MVFLQRTRSRIMAKKHTGQCACGAVKFEFETDPTFIADCYCKDCQKAGGGAMATFFAIPESDFTLLSGTPKAFHYTAQSGNGLDRNFCPECGARLFTSNLAGFPKTVFVTIGSLDNSDGIAPILEMFTKRRLKWTQHLDVPQFTDMPG
ncbi:GFA family protein [Paraburkholderia acidisoli]|nr:GFA family protein [Paraburkholderia acidisoli]